MPTNIQAATSTTGAVLDPSAGDGQLIIKTGATAGAQVNALSFAADGTPTFLKQPAVTTQSASYLVSGTAQNTTSGTSIDFTGIPSWVKRITLMFNGVSTNGASDWLIRIGSGAIDTTGYNAGSSYWSAGVATIASTAGFPMYQQQAAQAHFGAVVLCALGGNIWVASGTLNSGGGTGFSCNGTKTLSGALDRLRLTTANGTDTFDAGSVNILYE